MARPLAASLLLAGPLLLAACAPASAPVRPAAPLPPPAARRAILVSFDSFSPARLAETLPPEAIPTFRRLFAAPACVAARPAFPSVTAPGHAALWTGAYGDVNGIAANEQPRLPRAAHALTDLATGYSNLPLRAEPLWIAAARQGRTVVGHHVTQAPGAPGYPAVDASEEPAMAARRAEAEAALARPEARVINGYNRTVAPALVVSERTHPLRPARTSGPNGWANVPASALVPREAAWTAGPDSVFALFTGAERYDRVYIGFARDAARAVRADVHAEETALPQGRPLARFFSPPLERAVEGGRVYLRARLFALAPDASAFTLFVPAMPLVEANRPDVAAAYDAAVQGWTGNGAYGLVGRGFGPALQDGGDGTAERRYLESAELAAETSLRGTRWAWAQRPDLLLDYFALGDEVDHQFYGWTAPERPGFDAALAARMNALRAHVWALADRKLALLDSLARTTPGTLLVVSGDHGMRATWREFRPNVVLAAAGLLATDAQGRIDLAQTDALSPSGYFVSVNTLGRPGGRVAPREKEAVLARAEAALLALRDETGAPVVTRTWRATTPEALGAGGPVGGDLYYDLAPGYYWNRAATGAAAGPGRVFANHGLPPTAPDMQTGLCLVGAPAPVAPARIIDAAPTVAGWLGLDPPRDAVGRSVLRR